MPLSPLYFLLAFYLLFFASLSLMFLIFLNGFLPIDFFIRLLNARQDKMRLSFFRYLLISHNCIEHISLVGNISSPSLSFEYLCTYLCWASL